MMNIEQFEDRTKSLLAVVSILSTDEDSHMKLSAIQLIIDELSRKDVEFSQMCKKLEN